LSVLLVCSCHSSGQGTPPPDPPDPEEVDTVNGLELSDIYLSHWGDCDKNTWTYEPPVHNAYFQEEKEWKNVELHGYFRKLVPYVYLDIQTWTKNDDQYQLNTPVDLSGELDSANCANCVKYFEECDDISTGKQKCETVYWAAEGTLTITQRDAEIGGAFKGVLKDVLFKEVQMPLPSSGKIVFVKDGQQLCVKEYKFEETIEQY